jgi:hypothetical protein
VALHAASTDGSAKREKIGALLEALAAAVFDSPERFTRQQPLLAVVCESIFSLREHASVSKVTSAFVSVVRLAFARPASAELSRGLAERMIVDSRFAITTLQLHYREFVDGVNEGRLAGGRAPPNPGLLRRPSGRVWPVR